MGMLAAAGGAEALAQPVQAPANTLPPELAREAPPPSPFLPRDSAAPASPKQGGDTAEPIRRVVVTADVSGAGAIPPAGWTPPADQSGGVGLRHREGQPLDAQWVQSQFDSAAAGGELRVSDAVALVQLINRAFITAGFINSGLLVDGRQGPAGDVLNLRLVYGRLSTGNASEPAVTVEWHRNRSGGLSANYVRSRFRSASGQPLNAFALERDFRLLDENPGIRSISAALRPGTEPGQASLHLIVNPADRFDLYMGASNDRSPSVGGDRLFAGGVAKNLLMSGDLFSVEGGITRGVKDGQAAYSMPFLTPALSLNLRASMNNAAVITSALVPLDIRAKDLSAEAGLAYKILQEPLMARGALRRWSASQGLVAGVHYLRRRQKSYLLGQPFSFAPGSVDGRSEYEAMRLSADYLRRDQRRVIALSVAATVGLSGTRSDVPGIPNPDRHLLALLGQLNFAQRLGQAFELRGRLTAQHSRGTLYSGLRLAVGGSSSVRGYRENLFLVDQGLIGSLELARTFSLSGERRRNGPDWGAFAASVFVDAATFRNAEAPQPSEDVISSIGPALAWTPSSAFQASIAYGHALKTVTMPGKRSLQDRGIHFRIRVHPLGLF